MTKKELIDLIHLNVSGGKLSPDINISRSNIAAMLPLAISEAIRVYNLEQRREKENEIRAFGGSEINPNESLLSTYKVTPTKDNDRGLYYISLPYGVEPLPGNTGIDEIFTANTDVSYVKVPSPSALIGLTMMDTTFFWYEKQGDGSNLVFFRNMGLPVCDLYIRMVVDINDLGENTVLPIPSGFGMGIVERLLNVYYSIINRGADNIENDKEDGESRN